MKTLAVILSFVALSSCNPVSTEDSVLRSVLGNLVNCNSDLSLCMKEHALKAAARLGAARKLQIFEGLTLHNHNPKEFRSLESLSEDSSLRSREVTERLWDSTSAILQSSELEFSYGGSDEDEAESRAIGDEVESRGKKKKAIKKKLKLLIPLVLLAKAKAVALVVISLVVIAAAIFKLALLAKVAFIFKVFSLIKELLAKKHGQEESWQPQGWDSGNHAVADHGHGWGESGWSRSRKEANNLAYSAYGN